MLVLLVLALLVPAVVLETALGPRAAWVQDTAAAAVVVVVALEKPWKH